MIEKVRKYLIENIAYVVVFSFAGVYLIIKKGTDYTLNYVSILLGLFVPLFIVINLYSIIKSMILGEKLDYRELIVALLLLCLTIIIYLFGLKESQQIVIGLINGVTSILLVVIMLFITNRRQMKKPGTAGLFLLYRFQFCRFNKIVERVENMVPVLSEINLMQFQENNDKEFFEALKETINALTQI